MRHALEAGDDVGALRDRVSLLRDLDCAGEAVEVCRRAVEADHTNAMAMAMLGNLTRRDGHLQEVERWFRRAVETGDANAMWDLGRPTEKAGRLQAAERWYRRGAEAGGTSVILRLSYLLRNDGRKAGPSSGATDLE